MNVGRRRRGTRLGGWQTSLLLIGMFSFTVGPARAVESCADLDGDSYVAGAGCATEEDCNDQDPGIHPLAPEACNGVDDNCDGELDEGCDKTCPSFGLVRRHPIEVGASDGRIALANRGFAVAVSESVDGYLYASTRLDERGQEVCPDRHFTSSFANNVEIVWTGAEMAAAWSHLRSSVPEAPGARFRKLGPWGNTPPAEIWLENREAFNYDLVWNGADFAQLWSVNEGLPGIDGTRLHRFSPQGGILDGSTYLSSEKFTYNTLAWNGSGYGWVFQREGGTIDIYFQKLDRSGQKVGPEVRLTDHSPGGFTQNPRLVSKGAGQGYGLIWADTRTGAKQIWYASLAEDGAVVAPPGQVQVSLANSWGVSQQADLAWTGQEFLVVWPELPFPQSCGVAGPLKAARISGAGAVLERRTLANDFCSGDPRLAWNGRYYGMVHEQHDNYPSGSPNVAYVEIGCRCQQDADSDGVLSCAPFNDCDDTDPTVATGKPEICSDLKDNDCDGLVDCNDPSCQQTGNAPGEIVSVAIGADKSTVSWAADPAATRYDVVRGTFGDLVDMENFRWAACFASETTSTSVSDPSVPKGGTGYYYVVRGRAQTCLLGTWGTSLRDSTIRECP